MVQRAACAAWHERQMWGSVLPLGWDSRLLALGRGSTRTSCPVESNQHCSGNGCGCGCGCCC